jgi:hypothetical protein
MGFILIVFKEFILYEINKEKIYNSFMGLFDGYFFKNYDKRMRILYYLI